MSRSWQDDPPDWEHEGARGAYLLVIVLCLAFGLAVVGLLALT